MKEILVTDKAPKPVGPYSQAIRAGKFLFVSGQLPIDPKDGKIVPSDITVQTSRTLENIKAILKTVNYTLSDIVQTHVYLSSMTLLKEFNNTYATYFNKDFPTRVTVGAELVPGALLEISAIAYKE